jgi:diguanylate cyclase (GGDEF)-like protein
MDAAFLPTRHEPAVVLASYAIAAFASYVALDLAGRVRSEDRQLARLWWGGGALALGTGIWAMHFVGMLGFDVGLPLGYAPGTTLLSWLAAVLAGAVALAVATRPRLSPGLLAGGALAMASGICAMHYLGMAALEMAPGIVWHWPMVAASVVVALGASAAALGLFFLMRRFRGVERLRVQLAAALVMGLAVAGMHYTGMAAAQLPLGSLCLSTEGLHGRGLLATVGVSSLVLLAVALVTSINDARRQARERALRHSLLAANTELQSANAELARLAFTDALTGLPNRALFEDRLQHAAARLARDGAGKSGNAQRLAVLFINLDGFKPVNDSLGHQAGDALLREVAQRLRTAAGEGDTLARVGGDEFVLLIESHDPAADAVASAETVLEALKQPFRTEQADRPGEVSLGGSVGIAVHPDHGQAAQLVARADAAMQAAKRSGGNAWAVYENRMSDGASEQVALQQALRVALQRGELSLHFQPKVFAAGGAISGVEALLRWQHPERGWISPALFVPVAERFGLIGAIGRWVIDEGCAQLARWNAAGRHCRMAINLSPHQLRQHDLVSQVAGLIEKHGLHPSQLVFEITETAMMDNLAQQRAVLDALAALGVKISIDDFGTGYSSLAYLRRLPARQLKLDRSLVQDVVHAPDARAVLQAVVQLAHALRLEVVAEGVETSDQAEVLRSLRCDILQGWLVARPMPAAAVLGWMTAWETRQRDSNTSSDDEAADSVMLALRD